MLLLWDCGVIGPTSSVSSIREHTMKLRWQRARSTAALPQSLTSAGNERDFTRLSADIIKQTTNKTVDPSARAAKVAWYRLTGVGQLADDASLVSASFIHGRRKSDKRAPLPRRWSLSPPEKQSQSIGGNGRLRDTACAATDASCDASKPHRRSLFACGCWWTYCCGCCGCNCAKCHRVLITGAQDDGSLHLRHSV